MACDRRYRYNLRRMLVLLIGVACLLPVFLYTSVEWNLIASNEQFWQSYSYGSGMLVSNGSPPITTIGSGQTVTTVRQAVTTVRHVVDTVHPVDTTSPPVGTPAIKTHVATTVDEIGTETTTPVTPSTESVPDSWALYRPFDDEKVTSSTSRPDHNLLSKLQTDMLRLKTPIFKLKGTKLDLKIPKIIHQSWKDDSIPSVSVRWVTKWRTLNPDYTYMFWTDSRAETFIKTHYAFLWPFYNSWNIPVQKSDMFRVLAIYAFGGFWADLDMEPLKNFDPIRDWSSCVLARHPDIQTNLIDIYDRGDIYATNYTYTINAFFACRPAHPFLFYLINRLVQNTPLVTKEMCAMSRTVGCSGPRLMALSCAFYLRSVREQTRLDQPKYNVIVPAAEIFMPTYDTTYRQHIPRIRKRCRKPKDETERKICIQFRTHRNVPRRSSFTTHHWFHSYNFNKRTRYFNIHKMTKGLPVRTYDEDNLFELINVKELL